MILWVRIDCVRGCLWDISNSVKETCIVIFSSVEVRPRCVVFTPRQGKNMTFTLYAVADWQVYSRLQVQRRLWKYCKMKKNMLKVDFTFLLCLFSLHLVFLPLIWFETVLNHYNRNCSKKMWRVVLINLFVHGKMWDSHVHVHSMSCISE